MRLRDRRGPAPRHGLPARPLRTGGVRVRPRRAAAAVLAAAALSVPALAAPATAAPDAVLSTGPADGAVLSEAPDEVWLELSARPDPALSHVVVRDGAGTTVSTGAPALAGEHRLRQLVRPGAGGDYSVAYHVELAGGAEVAGILRFSVGTGRPPAGQAAVPIVDGGHGEHGVDPIGAVMLTVDAAVLLAVLVLLRRRPARQRIVGTPEPLERTRRGAPPSAADDAGDVAGATGRRLRPRRALDRWQEGFGSERYRKAGGGPRRQHRRGTRRQGPGRGI